MVMSAESSSSDATSSSGLQQNPSSQIPDAVRIGTEELVLSTAVSNPEGKDDWSEAGEDAKSQLLCSGDVGIIDPVGEGKKDVAWKKSSNGSIDVAGSVMGENTWPDLSMAAEVKVSRRSSSEDSLKNLSGVTVPISTLPLKSELVIRKNIPRGSSNHNSSSNSVGFPRQRSLKSGDRTGPPEKSDLIERAPMVAQQHLPPPPPPGVFSKVNSRRLANGPRPAPTYHNYGLKDQNYQPHSSKNYDSNPRRSFGYHNSNGAGRYQDHPRYGLNPNQPFYAPDAQMLQPYQQGGIFRPPLESPPLPPPTLTGPQYFFSSRPPVQPFINPHILSEVHPQIYGIPAPPQPPLEAYRYMLIPGQYAPYATQSDAILRKAAATQAEFYFSEQNLHNDSYLKNLMDPFGWVPISIIAGFNRMKLLTDDVQLISESLQSSATVEVQGDKMRRRNDWMRWLPPPALTLENHCASSSVPPETRGDQSPSTTDHANGACAEPAANQSTK